MNEMVIKQTIFIRETFWFLC